MQTRRTGFSCSLASSTCFLKFIPEARRREREAERRLFVPRIVQPGLASLVGESVFMLAPWFDAAFATQVAHGVSRFKDLAPEPPPVKSA